MTFIRWRVCREWFPDDYHPPAMDIIAVDPSWGEQSYQGHLQEILQIIDNNVDDHAAWVSMREWMSKRNRTTPTSQSTPPQKPKRPKVIKEATVKTWYGDPPEPIRSFMFPEYTGKISHP